MTSRIAANSLLVILLVKVDPTGEDAQQAKEALAKLKK
jgi:hypothetical protein